MQREELIRRLMATFTAELAEHVSSLNKELLALEKTELSSQQRAESIKNLFRAAHSLKGAARAVDVTPVERACHFMESVLARVQEGKRSLTPDLFELFFQAADGIEQAGRLLSARQDLEGSGLAELTPRLEAAAAGAVEVASGEQASARQAPAPARVERETDPTAQSQAPAAESGVAKRPADTSAESHVRVDATRLDSLLAHSAELLVATRGFEARAGELEALQEAVRSWQTRWRRAERPLGKLLGETSENGRSSLLPRHTRRELSLIGEQIDRLRRTLDGQAAALRRDERALQQAAKALDSQVHDMRLQPFASACHGLERAVRDLSRAAGKQLDLIIEGGDVELDRSVLERLKDPLLHLVRNAVDHGIETPEERRAAGKEPRARLQVEAALRSARVEVSVSDDGRGIDLERIRQIALRKGLPVPAAETELARLILLPGFSTAPSITEVSGRGVGLDVVNAQIEALHGVLDLAFEKDRGTRFLLTVPLTLTSVRGVLVEAAGQTFAVPATGVERILRVGAEDVRSVEGHEVITVDGALLPVTLLAEQLGLGAREPERSGGKALVLILSGGGRRMGFVVDACLSEQDLVVKSLGPRLEGLRSVAGGTILQDGRVVIILSSGELIRSALRPTSTRALAGALAGPEQPSSKRLLVADDSVTIRTLAQSILEAEGFEVLLASDGAEAWRILQESGADLVVSDVQMPRMDGFTLTETIRVSRRFASLPVILLTSLASEIDVQRGLEAGANAYLVKSSFEQQELLDTIHQLL